MGKFILRLAMILGCPFAYADVILTGDNPNSYKVAYLSSANDVYYKSCATAEFPKQDCQGSPGLGIARNLFNSKLSEFGQKDSNLVTLNNEITQLEAEVSYNNQNLKALQSRIQSMKSSIESNLSENMRLKSQIVAAKEKLKSGGLSETDKAEIQKFITQAENKIALNIKMNETLKSDIQTLENQYSNLLAKNDELEIKLEKKKVDKNSREQEIKDVISQIGSSLDNGTPLISFVNETAYFLVHAIFDLQNVPVSTCKVKTFDLDDGVARANVKFELTTGIFPIYPESATDSRRLELGSQNSFTLIYDKSSWIKTGTAYSFKSPLPTKNENYIRCTMNQVRVPDDLKYVGRTASYLYAGRFNRKQIMAVCKAATAGRSADGYDGYIFGSSDSLGYRAADLRQLMDWPPSMMTHTRVDNLSPLVPGRYAWAYQPGCCGGGNGNYIFNFDKNEEDSSVRRPEWHNVVSVFGNKADDVEIPTICSGGVFDRY